MLICDTNFDLYGGCLTSLSPVMVCNFKVATATSNPLLCLASAAVAAGDNGAAGMLQGPDEQTLLKRV